MWDDGVRARTNFRELGGSALSHVVWKVMVGREQEKGVVAPRSNCRQRPRKEIYSMSMKTIRRAYRILVREEPRPGILEMGAIE